MPPRFAPTYTNIPNPQGPVTAPDEKQLTNAEYQREWRKRNPDYTKRRTRKQSRPEVQRNYYLQRTYGISLDDVNKLVLAQKGKCAVCFKEARLYVDHDHETGELRSLLCPGCNAGIGLLKEDPNILRQAAAYLEAWRIKHGL